MKKTQHLALNPIQVTCITCEKRFQIFSTLTKSFKVDVCSNCHAFYLGTQKFESKAGRIERFRRIQRQKVVLMERAPQSSSPKKIITATTRTPDKIKKEDSLSRTPTKKEKTDV